MNCDKAKDLMADYIGQDLYEDTKEEMACHLDECDSCFNEIKEIDRVIWALECDCRTVKTPSGFLSGMEEMAVKGIKPRISIPKVKIPKKVIWIASSVLTAALIVFAFVHFAPLNLKYKLYSAATFGKVYSTDDGTFGRRLNISSTSSNIKVTATKISADDMGTVIHFKVDGQDNPCYADYSSIVVKEKLNLHSPLVINPSGGISIESGGFILYLNPVDAGTKLLHISFTRIFPLTADMNGDAVSGTWSFAIPVDKINSVSYDLNKDYNLDGYGITFKKLVTGPTGTYLQYNCSRENPEKYMAGFFDWELVSGSQRCEQVTAVGFSQNSYIARFQSIYPNDSGKMALNIRSYNETTNYKEPIKIRVNLSGPFPMEFKYMGNTITIDNFKNDGGNIQYDMIEPRRKRNYIYMFTSPEDSDGSVLNASYTSQKLYIIDENNVEYDYEDIKKNYTKYQGKHLQFYPIDTAVNFKMPDKDSKYFYIVISGSQSINKVNKTVNLK